jgi:hypothetical protein
MTDEEISKLAAQLVQALAGPIQAMLQAQHALLVAAIQRGNDNKGEQPITKKQFQAIILTGKPLFGNGEDQATDDQL